jgi:hypothetical protein
MSRTHKNVGLQCNGLRLVRRPSGAVAARRAAAALKLELEDTCRVSSPNRQVPVPPDAWHGKNVAGYNHSRAARKACGKR